MFGVVTYKDPDKKIFHSYGTLVGVAAEAPVVKQESLFSGLFNGGASNYSRNEWQLIIVGVERFKILNISDDTGVTYATIKIENDLDAKISEDMVEYLRVSGKNYLKNPNFPDSLILERENYINSEKDPSNLGFYIAHFLDLSVEDKQKLLENFKLSDRTSKIISFANNLLSDDQLSREVASKMKEDIKKKIGSRGENIAIRSQNEISKLEGKVQKLLIPEESKTILTEEISRLKSMAKSHPEYNMIRNYLEVAVNLPWGVSTKDNYDLENSRVQLDKDHFGLEQVKKRVLEYIAVRGLKGDMKGTILCFTGPPGVGKTSLGKSIADAIGRKFFRISLGGVRDEAEIRGHRKTYIASMPGIFINALKRCGSDNPVILLDEIDKVGASQRGDPASALLEVLDPAQNHSFTDHFLAIPFDLSKVLFIATANRPEIIPEPLLDRMEQIEITGYSTYEKLDIAKRFLIPKQISENGIKSELFSIPDSSLNKIILSYTRESGVRQLERSIGAVCRWVAVKYSNDLKGKKISTEEVITEALVEEILGIPIFENDLAERVAMPGIALGMAWTSYGGKVLIVETSKSPGNGHLRITGKLGDVMKESVLTAISWIKGNLFELVPKSIENSKNSEGFEGIDLHIHFPAAAVPKDGPSAGITIATALVSLLSSVRVRNDTAMTGEISLIGEVLPIGGLKEKVLGAHRVGIKRIILPLANKKDLKDIPKHIASELEFITVKNIREVLGHALEKNTFTQVPKL